MARIAKREILGLFRTPEEAADAVEGLHREGFTGKDYDILTAAPYPEGTFGEEKVKHRLFVFPFIGAACGFAVALLLTMGTQLAYPLVTGGKPILAIPPAIIVIYEGTMLGAVLFTVLGIIFESRLPDLDIYDPRISEGYIGIAVTPQRPELDLAKAEQVLREAGAIDVVSGA